jgi:hypothetical protein
MAHKEKGNSRTLFHNGPVEDINIRGNPGKPIPIGAMAQKPAFGGMIFFAGGLSVAPLIRGPDFNAFRPQAPGEP